MDSGNSGSMQSSSGGGDEEYDSRAGAGSGSISAILNPPGNFRSGSYPPRPPPPYHHHSTTMFDPLPSYFPNLDPVWSKTLRSEPNSTLTQINPPPPVPAPVQLPPARSTSNQLNSVIRNPKKRSRASRRAPTTVLTTDTANFRAMVQEFTGIPAPPFASSPFPRGGRLDLFGAPSSIRSHPHLLRPFAQKLQPPPFLSSSSLLSSSMGDAFTSGSATNSSTDQLGLLNMQNPILTFLQNTPPRYPLQNSATLQHNSGLLNAVSPDPTAPRSTQVNPASWGSNNGVLRSFNGDYVQGEKGSGEGMVESWLCSSD